MSIALMPDQQQAHDFLYEWFLNPEAPQYAHLEARAGTGKSTMLAQLIKSLNEFYETSNQLLSAKVDFTVTAAAPTHAAVSVLSDLDCRTITVSSLLGFIGEWKDGDLIMVPTERSLIEAISAYLREYKQQNPTSLLIIDEASYLTEQDIDYLTPVVQQCPWLKVLFVYDTRQLKPVNCTDLLVLHPDLNGPKTTLSTFKRFIDKSGGIVQFLEEMYPAVDDHSLDIPDIPKAHDIEEISYDDVGNLLLRLDKDDDTIFNSNNYRYMAFTNKAVNAVNDFMLEELFGTKELTVGMHVILNATCTFTLKATTSAAASYLSIFDSLCRTDAMSISQAQSALTAGNRYPVRGMNNSTYIVTDIKPFDDAFESYKNVGIDPLAKMVIDSRIQHLIHIIFNSAKIVTLSKGTMLYKVLYVPQSLKADIIKQAARLKIIHFIKEFIADLRPAYGCTVHKAQGSTYRYAILDAVDLLENCKDEDTLRRLILVGMSRARNKVYVITS